MVFKGENGSLGLVEFAASSVHLPVKIDSRARVGVSREREREKAGTFHN